jgi:hypothetical protein
MAFKMKGSPINRGEIQGTSGHSALKAGIILKTIQKYGPKVHKYFKKTKVGGQIDDAWVNLRDDLFKNDTKQLGNTKFVRHTDPKLSHNIMKAIDLSKKHTGKGERNLVWFGKGGADSYKYGGRETFTANFTFKNPVHFPTNKVFKNKELKDLLNKGHDMVIMGKGDGAHYMPLDKNTIKNLTKVK